MEKIPQGKYTKEFQEEAAEMVTEQGLNIPGAGRRLSIPESTIANRVRSAKAGYIVSEDNNLLDPGEFEGIKIVNPSQSLEIIRKDA